MKISDKVRVNKNYTGYAQGQEGTIIQASPVYDWKVQLDDGGVIPFHEDELELVTSRFTVGDQVRVQSYPSGKGRVVEVHDHGYSIHLSGYKRPLYFGEGANITLIEEKAGGMEDAIRELTHQIEMLRMTMEDQ